jgi:hypothetical protein
VKRKEKISLLLVVMLLSGALAGSLYYAIAFQSEITVSGKIVMVEHPPVLEEIPYNYTFALMEDKETIHYLVYKNQTMINPNDEQYKKLIGEEVTIRGKTRYARNMNQTKEYHVIIVSELKER